jgi:autotransporter-associated beta strand protein
MRMTRRALGVLCAAITVSAPAFGAISLWADNNTNATAGSGTTQITWTGTTAVWNKDSTGLNAQGVLVTTSANPEADLFFYAGTDANDLNRVVSVGTSGAAATVTARSLTLEEGSVTFNVSSQNSVVQLIDASDTGVSILNNSTSATNRKLGFNSSVALEFDDPLTLSGTGNTLDFQGPFRGIGNTTTSKTVTFNTKSQIVSFGAIEPAVSGTWKFNDDATGTGTDVRFAATTNRQNFGTGKLVTAGKVTIRTLSTGSLLGAGTYYTFANNGLDIGGTTTFFDNSNVNAQSIAINGPVTLTGAAGQRGLNVNGGNAATAFMVLRLNGALGEETTGIGLIKGGSKGAAGPAVGTLELTQPSTYTGPTTVASGTLKLLAGSSISSSSGYGIAAGATLDASAVAPFVVGITKTLSGGGSITGGSLLGDLTVNGTVAPGASIGTLNVTGSVTLAGTSNFEIARTGGLLPAYDWDELNATGTMTLGGVLNVTYDATHTDALTAGDTFDLFDASAFAGSFTNINLPTLSSGLGWDVSQLGAGGTGSISVVAVPEPSTTFATGLTLSLVLRRRRATA